MTTTDLPNQTLQEREGQLEGHLHVHCHAKHAKHTFLTQKRSEFATRLTDWLKGHTHNGRMYKGSSVSNLRAPTFSPLSKWHKSPCPILLKQPCIHYLLAASTYRRLAIQELPH